MNRKAKNAACKFIAVVVALACAAVGVLACFECGFYGMMYGRTSAAGAESGSLRAFSAEDLGDGYMLFSNHYDGYEIKVPSGMSIDMSMAEVCAVIYDDVTRIEIYRQDLNGESAEGYINYSNKFAADSKIRVIESRYVDDEETVHLFMWSRGKIMDGDRNYYASVDIVDEKSNVVFSILYKTQREIDDYSDISYLADSLKPAYRVSQAPHAANTGKIDLNKADGIFSRWNSETAAFYGRYLSEVMAGLSWGIFEPDSSNFDYNTVHRYEKEFGYKFPVVLNYTQISEKKSNLAERLSMAWNEGKVTELTLQMTALDEGNMMYELLGGQYDDFLNEYAKTIADFKHPVLFRPLNEMNGDWCVYSAYHTCKDTEIYKAVYKYIYDIFGKHGALENTIWVWNPNSRSFPNYKWNDAFMYYPGDEYVDVVGLTAYNTGCYYYTYGEEWREFADLYSDLYDEYAKRFAKPLIITEFACAEFGGDKAAWMEEMFKVIAGMDRIKIAIWWDGCDWDAYGNVARAYYIDSSSESLSTFGRGIRGEFDIEAPNPDFSSAYTGEKLEKMKAELEENKAAAFAEGTTVEEYLGKGRPDTRPSWLMQKRDGSFGYSDKKLKELQEINKLSKGE